VAAGSIISGGRERRDCEERARRAASGFRALGVEAGDAVALLLRNDFAFFEAAVGACHLGASPVALNWHLARPEIAYVLADSNAKIVVAHADLLDVIGEAIPRDVTLLVVETPPELRAAYSLEAHLRAPRTGQMDWDDWLAGYEPLAEIERRFTDAMIYTSGTTGKPKGVRRFPQAPETAEKFLRLRDQIYGIRPNMRALICGPLYHSAPNAFGMRCVSAAEIIVLMPRFNPLTFLKLVEKHRITTVFMVPTMFARLLKLPPDERARFDVSSLEYVLTAAAHCPPDIKAAMQDWFGPIVHEFYGSTESSYVAYCNAQDSVRKPGTVGRLVEGVTLRVLDEAGREVAQGERGELYTSLDIAPEFTYNNRQADRDALEIDGLLATGDIGYLDEDGYLLLCDRRRDMVISGGVNIYPAEIECELIAMKEVNDCAVFGIPDPEFGEKLMAVVQFRQGMRASEGDIVSFLKTRLAGFKVPRIIEIRDDLPRDDSGKIYKRMISEPYWADQQRRA